VNEHQKPTGKPNLRMIVADHSTGRIIGDLVDETGASQVRPGPSSAIHARQSTNASAREQALLKSILSSIAKLSGLRYDGSIRLAHDPHVERWQMQELLDTGLAEPWMVREFCSREEWADTLVKNPGLGDNRDGFPKSKSGMELLGKYVILEKKIVIFDTVCKMVSQTMHLRGSDDLEQVVLGHEAAHCVTHLGRDSRGQIWERFDHAAPKDVELFAQIYDLLYLKTCPDPGLERIFRDLSRHQSQLYNAWKSLERRSKDEIGQALIEARKRSDQSSLQVMAKYFTRRRRPRPMSDEARIVLEHIVDLEYRIKKPDWTWERGYRVADAIESDVLGPGGAHSTGILIDVIPVRQAKLPPCAPVLVVIIGHGRDGLETRMREASAHVNASCGGHVHAVIFWTTRWNSLMWMRHSDSFSGLSVYLKLTGVEPVQLS